MLLKVLTEINVQACVCLHLCALVCANLAGILGSALADETTIREFIPPWLDGK